MRSLSCLIADVAVKITPTSVVRSACKEVTALTRLNHAHIVQLLGVQVDMAEERVYMVMELCHGGELFDRIAESGKMEEGIARRYFGQVRVRVRVRVSDRPNPSPRPSPSPNPSPTLARWSRPCSTATRARSSTAT